MKHTASLTIVAALLTLALAACTAPKPSVSAPAAAQKVDTTRTNIVFVLVDDLGWMDLGVQGNPWYPTPNIDRLATEGLRFTDAYPASPVSVPNPKFDAERRGEWGKR